MKTLELRQKTKEELQKILSQEREKLRNLRFGLELKKNKNVREIRKTKKNIARSLTILKGFLPAFSGIRKPLPPSP